jgi:Glycosyltransferase family 87/WD40-like Beta Propeller Repeat
MANNEEPRESLGLGDSGVHGRKQNVAVAAVEYVAILALAGVFIWRGFLPAWNGLNTDFPNYYLAARLYHEGYSLDQLYNWTWMQRQKDHAGIQRPIIAYAVETPFSLLPVLPFSGLPPLKAKRGWLLLNLGFLVLTAGLLRRMSGLGARRTVLLILLAIEPLRTNFLFGQEDILLLLLFTLGAWFYLRNRPLSSGAVLAIAASLKIYPGLYVLFFGFKKKWRAACSLLAGTAALWLISAGLFGFEVVRIYLTEVLPWPLRAEGQDPYSITWNSFSALLHRLFIYEPTLNLHPPVYAPVAYAILQALCQALIFVPCVWLISHARRDAGLEKLEWGVFVPMLLMLSTNPASFDFVALILTAVFAVSYLLKANRRREAGLLVVLYALVCYPTYRWVPAVVSGWHALLGFPRLWSLTAFWVCLLVVLARSLRRVLNSALRWQRLAAFGALGAALVTVGITTNLASQHGEFQNYTDRLASSPGALLSTDPVLAGSALLFTTMTSRGYGTADLVGGKLHLLPFSSDSFHPTGVPGSSFAWVELAARHSRVVRFTVDANGASIRNMVVEAENAQKPAVSPDLHWLAFIRESRGRGALWVKSFQGNSGSVERRLSPSGFNVLGAAFAPDDHIVFAARHNRRRPALFTTWPESGGIVARSGPEPRRYPAFSPDGRWFAFCQLQRGNWQLWVRDRSTHTERQLTDNNCNSVAPAWYPDSKYLVYASDCARGRGLTALCRIQAVP